ncbi:unnamed protein product [Closterium sp. NIES-53]
MKEKNFSIMFGSKLSASFPGVSVDSAAGLVAVPSSVCRPEVGGGVGVVPRDPLEELLSFSLIGAHGTGGVEGAGSGDPTESGDTSAGGSNAGGAGAGGAGVGGPGVGGASWELWWSGYSRLVPTAK